MAHHKSAQKRIRRNDRCAAVNLARKNRIRTYIRKVEDAIKSGDKAAAEAALRAAQPEIHRGINKGVLRHGTAGRKISRLNARVKSLG